MNLEDLANQPQADDKLIVTLRERCSIEAFQMWVDQKMPGWKIKRVMAEEPCNIAIVVEHK